MTNRLIKQSDIKALITDKLNDEIINHFFKYLERQENIVIENIVRKQENIVRFSSF